MKSIHLYLAIENLTTKNKSEKYTYIYIYTKIIMMILTDMF